MKRSLAVLLLTTFSPSIVAAQEISGGITLGFGQHDILDQGLDTTTVDGRMTIGFENGVKLGVSAGYLDLGIDGIPGSLNARHLGLDLGYTFGNGVSAGAYVEQLTGSVDGLPVDLKLKSIGTEVGYTTGNLQFGAHIGRSSTSPDLGVDIDNLGLTARYAPAETLDVAGAFLRATLEGGGTEVDVDMLGLAAIYDINEQFSLFSGVSRTEIEEVDVTTMGLGVGYDLGSFTGISSTVSLELAQTELSLGGASEDLDTVRLGLTFPLGGKGSEAPLNSVADSIFNPRRGALNAALTGAF